MLVPVPLNLLKAEDDRSNETGVLLEADPRKEQERGGMTAWGGGW